MDEQSPASKKIPWGQIIVAGIGMFGVVIGSYFAYRSATDPLKLSLSATQTAEAKLLVALQLATSTATPTLAPTWTPTETVTPTITPTWTPTPVVIVDTNSVGGWVTDFNNTKDDKTKNRIELSGNAIKLSYLLGADGYVILTKKFNSKTLAGTDGISFSYMGEGLYNTLEFKLLLRYPDHGGDTIYGIIWNGATNTDGKWLEMKVPYSDLWCWGPPSDCAEHPDVDIKMVDRLDFAVSNKTGNPPSPGWILIKDVFGIMP